MNLARLAGNHNDSSLLVRDFPGGPVVKNPLCNAGDASLIPGQGTKIPHAGGVTKPRAEPVHHSETPHMMKQRYHELQLRPDAAK